MKNKPNRKLEPRDVHQIRDFYSKGIKPKELAKTFGVSEKQISVILNRHQWDNVRHESGVMWSDILREYEED